MATALSCKVRKPRARGRFLTHTKPGYGNRRLIRLDGSKPDPIDNTMRMDRVTACATLNLAAYYREIASYSCVNKLKLQVGFDTSSLILNHGLQR